MDKNSTVKDVAQWMQAELTNRRQLDQDYAAHNIFRIFGEQFTYINENGNRAISKDVLKAFKKISGDSVVWERGQRCWRKREKYDRPGRQQE